HFAIGHLPRGRILVWREGRHPITHPPGSDGKHAAKLSAAQHANCGTGEDCAHSPDSTGSVALSTDSVCEARNCRNFSRNSGREFETIATASNAALRAPALPIASVATGTPPGIWTMERRESRPLRAALSTGTPKTGT